MNTAPFLKVAKTANEKRLLTAQSEYYELMLSHEKRKVRVEQVFKFRRDVLDQVGVEALGALPDAGTMIAESKDLTHANYLPIEFRF